MDEPLWTCSGDSHFIEPPDLFTKNLTPDLAARLPGRPPEPTPDGS